MDCKTILYEDMSSWMGGTNYYKPEFYEVWISQGGAGRRLEVKTEGHTKITTEALGLGDDGILPEGAYCFKTESCNGVKYTRYRMNTCRLECCLQEYIYQLVHRDAQSNDYEIVEQIERLLDISRHNASINNIEYAIKVYEEAKTTIEDLNCNCNCLK